MPLPGTLDLAYEISRTSCHPVQFTALLVGQMRNFSSSASLLRSSHSVRVYLHPWSTSLFPLAGWLALLAVAQASRSHALSMR